MFKKSISIVIFLSAIILTLFSLFSLIVAVSSAFDNNFINASIWATIFFSVSFTTKTLYQISIRIWKKSRFTKKECIKVTLMGGRGVGKTSLLTAMYVQFDKIPYLNLKFIPDSSTSALLTNCLKELKSQISKPETGTLAATTELPPQYKFNVRGLHSKSQIFDLIFRDFPGDYLEDKQIKQKFNDVANFISDSDVIMIAVDTPALLEEDGDNQWDEMINRCQRISDLFKHGLGNDQRKLVLLVPIKCEKYLQSGEHHHVLESIKKKYAALINGLSNVKEHIAISVVPIQTLGGIVFDRIQVDHGVPRFFYKRSEMVKGYSPHDTDQPLRHILTFSLSLLEKKIDLEPKKISEAFREDRLTLYRGIKKSIDGFEILQGEHLISP